MDQHQNFSVNKLKAAETLHQLLTGVCRFLANVCHLNTLKDAVITFRLVFIMSLNVIPPLTIQSSVSNH